MGMGYKGGDFGFVGQAYEAPDPYQDSQRLINWYPEISQDDKSKTPVALLGCPGLSTVLDFGGDPEGVRGVWVLPGGTDALWVVGDRVYLSQMTVPATQTSIAQFAITEISGSLLTNSGPVCIRDNGVGGYAVIVDGIYGYTYQIATQTLAQITSADFPGALRIAFIDGWLIFNEPGTQRFFTNAPTPYTVTFSASFFALKDSSSDNLITLMENNRELWLIGERTSEVWYNAGGANFAFSRIPGVAPQIGCSAPNSITRVGTSLGWLATNEQGQNIVVLTKQYSYEVVSTVAVSAAISSYPLISDAIGFAYEEDGHVFFVLTFPTADKTWVLDVTTRMWHQRASFEPETGAFHRFKGSCFANYQNIRMVGDYQDSLAYQMSRQIYLDGETPLIAVRRCPHLWSREDRKRMFHGSLQVEFAPGVGLQTGQGSNPQAMMRFSDDGGATFGTERWTSIGMAGQYKNRAMWRRLGHARDRVYEVRISDPVKRDVVGATLFAQGEVQG